MKTLAILLLLSLALAACEQSHADVLAPSLAANTPAPQPVPAPVPVPAPAPSLSVTVKQIIPGNPQFSGPQDAWHVILQYDYTPDPLYPCVVVKTYYEWQDAGILRTNVKIWDCVAKPGPIVDDFYDYAWSERSIKYSVQIFAASVNNGDWANGFCMGDPSDYWGTVDPNWLYCPISGAHPQGLRLATGTVAAKSPLPQVSKLILVTGFSQVLVP